MVNRHVKFGRDTIQIGSQGSTQIPSPGMVNLLLLLLRFLSNNGLPIIMPLLVFVSRFTKLLVHITLGMVNAHGKFGGEYNSKWKRQNQSNPFPWYGKFAFATVEIPFKRQATHHYYHA
jgi:hypothetical protein